MKWTDKITVTNECNMELMKRYDDNYFDLAVVDPPYGIGEDGLKNHSRGKATKATKYKSKKWDSSAPNKEYLKELIRVSRNQIIFGANHFIENIPNANSSCWVIWDKDNGKTDFADCEMAYTSFKTSVRIFKFKWQGMLQGNMKDKQKRIHPTEKPIQLYKWIYQKYAKQNYKIIDTHFGSGSNGIALHSINQIEKKNLSLVACETDIDYYKDSKKRFDIKISQGNLFS